MTNRRYKHNTGPEPVTEIPQIDEDGNAITLHPTKGYRRISAKRAKYMGRFQ